MDFTVGDVVRLKSDGPKMTVIGADEEGRITCKWFTRAGKTKEEAFPAEALMPFDRLVAGGVNVGRQEDE